MTGVAIGVATLGRELLLPQASEAANVKFPESDCGVENEKMGDSGRRLSGLE